MHDEKMLTARRTTHGDFTLHAELTQKLKHECNSYASVVREHRVTSQFDTSYRGLTHAQAEGLDMILHKIARIITGDPNELDHWKDISGYAARVVEHTNPANPAKPASPSVNYDLGA